MTLARTGQVYRGSPGPLFVALMLLWLSSAWSPAEARDAPVYQFQAPSRDGIGKVYMGREIARVMEHRGSDWLERASREREERPDQVVAAMVLTPDATVADIGAGTGYFSLRLAARVPRGRVYAVDIQPEMLRDLQRRVFRAGVSNVETVLGPETNPELPARSVDAVLLVDAYHEFSHPAEMLDRIYRALRPGGRLYLVEYRGEDVRVPIKPLHKMTEAQMALETAGAGLRYRETQAFLPNQHLMVFEKPAPNR